MGPLGGWSVEVDKRSSPDSDAFNSLLVAFRKKHYEPTSTVLIARNQSRINLRCLHGMEFCFLVVSTAPCLAPKDFSPPAKGFLVAERGGPYIVL